MLLFFHPACDRAACHADAAELYQRCIELFGDDTYSRHYLETVSLRPGVSVYGGYSQVANWTRNTSLYPVTIQNDTP